MIDTCLDDEAMAALTAGAKGPSWVLFGSSLAYRTFKVPLLASGGAARSRSAVALTPDTTPSSSEVGAKTVQVLSMAAEPVAEFTLPAPATIGGAKRQVMEATGILIEEQRLLLGLTELSDSSQMSDFAHVNGPLVVTLVRDPLQLWEELLTAIQKTFFEPHLLESGKPARLRCGYAVWCRAAGDHGGPRWHVVVLAPDGARIKDKMIASSLSAKVKQEAMRLVGQEPQHCMMSHACDLDDLRDAMSQP